MAKGGKKGLLGKGLGSSRGQKIRKEKAKGRIPRGRHTTCMN